jgi:DNA polymerase
VGAAFFAMLFYDLETRSHCDLKKAGAYNYAQDPTTEVLCAAYAFDDEDVQLWTPDQPFPQRIADHFKNGGQIRAHNAAFDRLITWYVICPDFKIPEPKLEQWYCTAAQARANCMPGSLEDVGRFVDASIKKNHRGSYLIRELSIPPYNPDPELMQEMYKYCMDDVASMRVISLNLRPLSDDELEDYHVNERINDRGIYVDVPLAHSAIKYATAEVEEVQNLVQEITNGEITSVRSTKMRDWVMARLGPEALKLCTVYKDGEAKVSMDKSVRTNLLAFDDYDQVPVDVCDVLQCASDIWASSVSKFTRMEQLADPEDYRVRGAFVFNGGSATGRFASYGLQLHNISKKTAKDPEAVRESMMRGEVLPNVLDTLKTMLRPALTADDGMQLVVADWNAIEARLNPWLSNEPNEVLDVFRAGQDVYVQAAKQIFSTDDIDEGKRFIGKVAILSLGYGGGVGAFTSMARLYGTIVEESDAQQIVTMWRRNNPWAVQYWSKIEEAYTRAMRNPGYEFSAGRVTYLFDKRHLWYALPSGRVLCYPFARFENDGITYAKASWKPKADAKEWPRAKLWHGVAVENICQAAANDLLRSSLRRCSDMEVVAHVHDEIIIQTNDAEKTQIALKNIMCTPLEWCSDLPLNVNIKTMFRYSK